MTRTKTGKRAPAKATPKAKPPAAKARPAMKAADSEVRRTDRTQLFVAASLYTELNPDVAHKVWVTNVSLGGVGFRTRRDFRAGAVYYLRLEAGPIELDSAVRVIWARPTGEGTFDVGCEFLPD